MAEKRYPVYLRLAEKEIKEKHFTKGIEILESAIHINPDNAAAYFLLGRAHAGDGNYRMALQNYRKGSELIKSEKTYQYYLREVEHLRNKTEEKVNTGRIDSVDFSELLDSGVYAKDNGSVEDVDIDENLISETLARIYMSQGQINEAVRIYTKLIKKYPMKKIYFETRISEIQSGIK
jgi:tetratricopeptide (TPR) repeat protein